MENSNLFHLFKTYSELINLELKRVKSLDGESRGHFICMVRQSDDINENQQLVMKFYGAQTIELTKVWSSCWIGIVPIQDRKWERIKYIVRGFEQDAGLYFICEDFKYTLEQKKPLEIVDPELI